MAKKSRHFFSSKPKKTPPSNDNAVAVPTDLSPRFTDPPEEFIRASSRFFVDVGPTGSLIEEARLSAATSGSPEAVVRESANPYLDFLRSMEEMVDAHRRRVNEPGPLDWEYLEELLGCYMELNERGLHECILRAFVDLTASLRRRRVDIV